MNRTVLVALFSGLAVTSASAADLAARPYTKAPPPAVASVYSWTGFYVGLNAGAVFNRSEFDMTASNFFTAAAQIGADGTTRLDRTGFIGGGQAGYNWQSGKFVVGVEADINYTDVNLSASITRATAPGLPNGYTVFESARSDWLFTLRPRAGVTVGNLLVYVTGGLAFADYNFTQGSVFPDCPCGVTTTVSKTKAGWTVGGGAEYAINSSWSVKAEYLYLDLGSASFADSLAAGGFPAATFTHSVNLTEHIGRVGFNYRWGGPVVAKY